MESSWMRHATSFGDSIEFGEDRGLHEVRELFDDEASLEGVLVHGKAPLLVNDHLNSERPTDRLG
jgi:hypothetical protein